MGASRITHWRILLRALRAQGGYTLTELMVTLGVVGILMGIAVPAIQIQIARQEVQGSARELVEILRGARDSAINEGVPRYVLLRPGSPGSYQVYRYNGTQWIPDENEVPLRGSVGFSAGDVSLPTLTSTPEAGATVPEDAAFFDTRGRYPFGHTGSYTIQLSGSSGDPVTITLYPQTGQVSGV